MSRVKANFIVDTIAFVAFVFLAATGVLMRFVLPPGSGHFSTLWGLDRHEWGTIHLWIAVGLLSALAIHLFFHWRWIICVIRGRPREGSGVRVVLALVGLLALIALAFSPFLGDVEQTGTPPHRLRATITKGAEGIEIRGSMTLRDVQELTGVSVEELLHRLNLPATISADERLGRLRRVYGFEMDDVRKIVQDRNQHK